MGPRDFLKWFIGWSKHGSRDRQCKGDADQKCAPGSSHSVREPSCNIPQCVQVFFFCFAAAAVREQKREIRQQSKKTKSKCQRRKQQTNKAVCVARKTETSLQDMGTTAGMSAAAIFVCGHDEDNLLITVVHVI